jgi:hypothetical protein
MFNRQPIRLLLVLSLLSLTACGQLISNAKKEFAEDLSDSILRHDDPETVKQALPAYLVLTDSMVRGDENNIGLLLSASKLYGSYTSVFVEDETRRKKLAQRAFTYAHRALCLHVGNENVTACNLQKASYAQFELALKKFNKQDAKILFALGSAWAGLIQANSTDWNAVAELPKVKAVIERVLELDETISNGDAHVYMGVLQSLLPPAMGGKPELAAKHFEQALKISNRTNLMAMLFYAEKYARLIFDRALHDKLLREIIASDSSQSQLRLIDTIAKAKAKTLLESADDYF